MKFMFVRATVTKLRESLSKIPKGFNVNSPGCVSEDTKTKRRFNPAGVELTALPPRNKCDDYFSGINPRIQQSNNPSPCPSVPIRGRCLGIWSLVIPWTLVLGDWSFRCGFRRRLHSWVTACFFLACFIFTAPAADPVSDALQKGLFEEEANHNLDAAIKAYQSVIDQTAEQRKLTATAVFRLGECYRKLKKTNEAAAQYQRVLREFSDVATLTTLSQQNLTALRNNASPEIGTNAATSAEAEEIAKIKAMISYSPDLINSPHQSGLTPLGMAALKGYLVVARFLLANKAETEVKDNSGQTALHYAVQGGHKTMVELLLDHGAQINALNGNKNTPLHIATSQGYRSIVEVLLARKADINAKGPNGRTPLHVAAMAGHSALALARLLLDRGADVNAQDEKGGNALQHAVSSPEMTKLILSYKPDLELQDEEGNTALITAAGARGDIRSIELLLQAGANVNRMTPSTATPLMAAIWRPNLEKVRLLLEHKADPNQKLQTDGSPLAWVLSRHDQRNITAGDKARFAEVADLLRKHGAKEVEIAPANRPAPAALSQASAAQDPDTQELERLKTRLKENPDLVNLRDSQRETPLHKAAAANHLKTALFLLANGADPNAKEHKNATPLHVAVYVGHKDMVRLLLTNAADPNIVGYYGSMLDGQPLYGQPLHIAVNEARFPIVEFLLANGANPNGKANWEKTPLHLALDKSYFESARLLVSKGADVNVRDSYGRTPLLTATSAGNERAINLLLEHNADINAQDNDGGGALHSAGSQSLRVLNALLAKKPQLDLENKSGYTPLMYALGGNLRNAELLLKAGANPNGHRHDRSLLIYAIHRLKSKEAVKLLLDYKADPNKPTAEGVTPLMYTSDPIKYSKIFGDTKSQMPTSADKKTFAEIAEILRKYGATEPAESAAAEP